jgi:hypothetical protein
MPYTPPSRSPSSLRSVSPVKSSSAAYAGLANGPIPQPTKDPLYTTQPPRTLHTKRYHHHRRSSGPTSPPRIPIHVSAFPSHLDRTAPKQDRQRRNSQSSNSSDDDDTIAESPPQTRHLPNLKELQDALKELPQHKIPSPPGSPDHRYQQVSKKDNLTLNNAEFVSYDSATSDGEQSSSTSPPEDTIEFPRMVRKKSGEIVKPSLKSPLLRRRPQSLPSTPVYPKAVHFDAQLEQVRHFNHAEKPLAVSTNTSPSEEFTANGFPFEKDYTDKSTEKQYQIELPNFPTGDLARQDATVRVESVHLSSTGRNLIGKVLVKNVAFEKWVAVRFTFDHWQTVSEVSGTYDATDSNKIAGYDRFTFSIKLQDFTNLENRQMYFCVRYNVTDHEFWDNNLGLNYQVEFRKRPNYLLRRASHPPETNGLPRVGDEGITDDFDIEISPETFAKNLAQQITSPRSALLANLGESPPMVKKAAVTASPSPGSDLPQGTTQKRPTGKAFANRYDFGASLSAAIANANVALGFEKSGLQKSVSPKPQGAIATDSYFAPLPQLFRSSPPVQSPTEIAKEDALVNDIKKTQLSGLQQAHHFRSRSYPLGSPVTSPGWGADETNRERFSPEENGKPPMDSHLYLDFLNNYCFVCSPPYHTDLLV